MTGADAFAEAAQRLGPSAQLEAPLGARTTYRVGGSARLLVTVESDDEIRRVGEVARAAEIPVITVGRGSNLLVADAGFDGIAVILGNAYGEVRVDADATTVTAGAAVALPALARVTAAAALTGLEWAVGIPGSVGGAVRMNAGGHGAETIDRLDAWAFVDLNGGADGVRGPDELGAGYRHTRVLAHHVVTWARFRVEQAGRAEAEAVIADIVRWRRANQPGGQNAGSVFTNPEGDSAGRLVEAAGCKGLRIGSAEVSPKHANFIQADPGGRATDVVALIAEVRRRVTEHSGVVLEPELRLVGFGEVSW